LRGTPTDRLSPIDAANPKTADARVGSGEAIGKTVLAGFWPGILRQCESNSIGGARSPPWGDTDRFADVRNLRHPVGQSEQPMNAAQDSVMKAAAAPPPSSRAYDAASLRGMAMAFAHAMSQPLTAMAIGIDALKLAAAWGAVALASAVFATDISLNLPTAVSILYLAVLMLGSWRRGRAAAIGWMQACFVLDIAAFITVHGMAPDLSSLLRLVFSLIAILITGTLLLSRLDLQSTRAAHRRAGQRTAEPARSEHRFLSVCYEMNIAFAETDTVLTKRLIDEAKAGGVTDFQTFVTEHPGIVARSRAGIRLIAMNDAVGHMLGYASGAEVLALPHTAFIEDPDRALLMQLEAIFEGRRRSTGSATFIRKDGSRILVAFQVNYPSDWTYGLVTYIDITEELRAHELVLAANEELARANRAATMGALSTSLAHELNQPITALAIDTRTTLRFLDQDPPDMTQGIGALERITRNVDRVNAIVRRTREQVVKGRRRTEAVALCDLALETQALLQRDLGNRDAILHIRCAPELPQVSVDRVELQQVLVNLIINAADAMTGLVDRPRLIEIDIEATSDEDVVVTVADNGPGIAEEDKSRVFQPFFTTKPEGMGMGLQICRSLVEAFGGALTVTNRPEGGAIFRFTLPVVAQHE
jgi:signal transduction histidine kinase